MRKLLALAAALVGATGTAIVFASVGSAAPIAKQSAYPTAQNGRIVFNSDREGPDFDIFAINPDGSGLVNLTASSPLDEFEPAISPDGTRIAFVRDLDPGPPFQFDLIVMDANGSDAVNLTPGFTASNEGSPAFSPDGKLIAFHSGRDGPDLDIFVVGVDGSAPTNLTNDTVDGDANPDFSPDGTRIAFERGAPGDREIAVINRDASGLVNLTNTPPVDDRHPSYSPDGQRIAFDTEVTISRDVFVMAADGSGPVNITNTPGVQDEGPAFSGDGTRIAFHRVVSGESFNLLTMSATGGGEVVLASGPAEESTAKWETLYLCGGRRATIVGSDAGATIRGTKKADVIVANGGRDKVSGGGGKDRICGGNGKDKLKGGAGSDRLFGQAGKDKLTGGKGRDILRGGKGKDTEKQ
jgi:Tol biopolymer transport system component